MELTNDQSLHPPYGVALTHAVDQLPPPDALPGGSRYEPKWAGIRLLAATNADGEPVLWSRQRTELTHAFPELRDALARQPFPSGTVVDGEAVVWTGGRLDFAALQRRLGYGPLAMTTVAHAAPASYVAFDVLAIEGQDVRQLPFDDRRRLLERLGATWSPPLGVSPSSVSIDEANEWLGRASDTGIEGIVVKGGGQPYAAGRRDWLNVRAQATVDVICAAVIGPTVQPEALIVGLPFNGVLRIVGRTSAIGGSRSRSLAPFIQRPHSVVPWPERVTRGTLDSTSRQPDETVDLTHIEPIVIEVAADVGWNGHMFGHQVRFVRVRPDLSPTEIETPERFRHGPEPESKQEGYGPLWTWAPV